MSLRPITLGSYTFFEYENHGARALLYPAAEARTAYIEIVTPLGLFADPEDKLGLSHFLEHSLFLGCGVYPDEQQFMDIASRRQIMPNASTGHEHMEISGSVPATRVDEALELWLSMLFEPVLPAERLDVERSVLADELRRSYEDQQGKIGLEYRKMMYPGQPRVQLRAIGSEEHVAGMTRDDLAAFHKAKMSTQGLRLFIGGKIDPQAVAATLDSLLAERPHHDTGLTYGAATSTPATERVLHSAALGSAQHDITLVAPLAVGEETINEADDIAYGIAWRYLTHLSNSVLFDELRTKTGLVYGVHSGTSMWRRWGAAYISTECSAERSAEVLARTRARLQQVADGQIDTELWQTAVDTFLFEREERLENWKYWPGAVYFDWSRGRTLMTPEQYLQQIHDTGPQILRSLAQQLLDGYEVVVGYD